MGREAVNYDQVTNFGRLITYRTLILLPFCHTATFSY